ncbi:hypothetical protein ACO2Q3_22450 [Caulobacter sp. KR2-114]
MLPRFAILALTALLLSGCAAVNCDTPDDHAGGGCRTHTTA